MFFCMHWEVSKKTQMSTMKRDIKMWFRGSFHLVCDCAKILISANDLRSALFMRKMYQNIGYEMFWFLFINSYLPTCSPADRKSSVQWENVNSLISKTFSQLTLGLYGTERVSLPTWDPLLVPHPLVKQFVSFKKLSTEFSDLSLSRRHQENASSKESAFLRDQNPERGSWDAAVMSVGGLVVSLWLTDFYLYPLFKHQVNIIFDFHHGFPGHS